MISWNISAYFFGFVLVLQPSAFVFVAILRNQSLTIIESSLWVAVKTGLPKALHQRTRPWGFDAKITTGTYAPEDNIDVDNGLLIRSILRKRAWPANNSNYLEPTSFKDWGDETKKAGKTWLDFGTENDGKVRPETYGQEVLLDAFPLNRSIRENIREEMQPLHWAPSCLPRMSWTLVRFIDADSRSRSLELSPSIARNMSTAFLNFDSASSSFPCAS